MEKSSARPDADLDLGVILDSIPGADAEGRVVDRDTWPRRRHEATDRRKVAAIRCRTFVEFAASRGWEFDDIVPDAHSFRLLHRARPGESVMVPYVDDPDRAEFAHVRDICTWLMLEHFAKSEGVTIEVVLDEYSRFPTPPPICDDGFRCAVCRKVNSDPKTRSRIAEILAPYVMAEKIAKSPFSEAIKKSAFARALAEDGSGLGIETLLSVLRGSHGSPTGKRDVH